MTQTPPLDEITENFAFLESWDDRFAYLIDLGKKLPPLAPELVTEAFRVHGCQSNVWLHLGITPGNKLRIQARSDAHIVNGLITVLLSAYNGRTPAEALRFDAPALLKQLGLEEHLSPTRRNGLHAMIQRIRTLASSQSQS